MMNIQLNDLENSRVELIVKIDKEEFCDAVQKSFKKNVSKYNVPGFRKGKVPFRIFKQMFGSEVLYNDAANLIIDRTYRKAIEENKIEVVDYPDINVITCNENEDFEYKATVYVKPKVKLGLYKGIEIEEVKYNVSEDDVNRELENLREKNSRIVSKESGSIENNDIAVIDFKGFIDDEAFEGGEGKNYDLTIGSKTFIDNFEEQLIGKNKGDEVIVNVKFPDDYNVENLKGKLAKFEVKINDVKVKELSNLDDNFAKNFSEFDTLDDLKNDIENRLKSNNENKQKYEFENSLIEKICDNVEVYIPEPMIESEIDRFVDDFGKKIQYQGISLDKYCQYYGITLDDIRGNFRDRAYKQVLSSLVLEEISKVENIGVSDSEIENKALELSKEYSQDQEKIDSIKNNLLNTYKSSLEKDILMSKTIEFLVKESKKINK